MIVLWAKGGQMDDLFQLTKVLLYSGRGHSGPATRTDDVVVRISASCSGDRAHTSLDAPGHSGVAAPHRPARPWP